MNILEIIKKKRLKQELTDEEIEYFVAGVTKDEFPDYVISSLLMAITINGMSEKETTKLTIEMAKSGDIVDLSKIKGIKADKHSTGGISDTTTLVIVPILASLGIKMAKMSGRGLGFTGGTADKLEAIDGYKTDITNELFIKNIKTIGASMITQTSDIAVADKKLYALRSVTDTVESIPLIASSIMSKKLASGADIILLDVKYGKGAFMKNEKDAISLANLMVKIGKNAGKKMCAIISSMAEPLGNGIGCTLEVRDAVNVLKGSVNRLSEVSVVICVEILKLAYGISEKEARIKVEDAIQSGLALKKLKQIVKAQGGNEKVVLNLDLLKKARYSKDIMATSIGKITEIDGEMLGNACNKLGGGRVKKDDKILHEVGIDMAVSLNDVVTPSTKLATVYYNKKDNIKEIVENIQNAFTIKNTNKNIKTKLISKIIR